MRGLRSVIRWCSRHRGLSIAILFTLLALGFWGRIWIDRSEGTVSEPLMRGPIVRSIYGIGTVVSNQSFQIRPGVMKHVDKIYVKEGDTVEKGQKLLNLDGSIWTAPFHGTVTYFPTTYTETVFPNTAILTLIDMSDRYLVVSLEQQGALKVRPGQKAKISFDSMREQAFDGVVQAIYSNENGFLARIDVRDFPPEILPGMTGDVAIVLEEKKDVLLVPVSALDNGRVWVKRGKFIPRAVPVTVGIVDRDQAELVGGDLQVGDRVLSKGKP